MKSGSRETMIEATIESIHLHGISRTTVSTATDIAGLSRGMVRRVFQSKAEMVAATMDRLRLDWSDASASIRSDRPEDDVEAIVRSMFAPNVFTTARVAAWIALSVEASTDELLQPIRERAQAEWTNQLADPLRRAGVASADEVAVILLAAADGLWLRHSLEPDAMPRELAERLAVMAVHSALA